MRQWIAVLWTLGFIAGCTAPYPWRESTLLLDGNSVLVRYLSRDDINEMARNLGYPSQANGFYYRGVAYCPDEESVQARLTCEHELRHAQAGNFHYDDKRIRRR